MFELQQPDFHRIALLFESLPYGPSIPNSVITGIGRGRVFANDLARPTAALVYNNGACTLAGAVEDVGFAEQVCKWLLEFHDSDYFILYAFPAAWEPVLDGIFGSAVNKRRRYDFDFNPSKFAQQMSWRNNVPPGYELRRIDEQLMQRIRDVENPFSRSYWKSASDFEQHGLGFCAIFQGAIVGMCYTAFAWGIYHDIDILTAEEHRRRGLAGVLASAFIEYCVKHGLVPSWDCWTKNEASLALAGRLGFEPRVEVSVYHGWEQ